MAVTIVCELGSCHDNDMGRFIDLIALASHAGCDVAKAQYWSNPDRLADRRRVPSEYRDIYRRYGMPASWLGLLEAECQRRKIRAGCSVYLPEDVWVVAPFVSLLKVASFESDDVALVKTCLATERELVVSYGMCALRGDDVFRPWKRLHCVTSYRAPLDELNLRAIGPNSWRRDFDGFSDHSADERVGAWAVCAGAEIVEVHIRLDDTDPSNPDYATALDPDQLRRYVRNIRDAELALGDGVKRVMPSEATCAQWKVQP